MRTNRESHPEEDRSAMEKESRKTGEAPDLRLAGIVPGSVVDGPGIRYTIFVQGCPHHCPGCHNPETHDPQGGTVLPAGEAARRILEEIDADPLLAGVTFSGGEPMAQAQALLPIAEAVRERGLNLMIYSGWTYEELEARAVTDQAVRRLLDLADYLVDGRFVLEERDLTLLYRGSRNQRFLDMDATRRTGAASVVPEQEWGSLDPDEIPAS